MQQHGYSRYPSDHPPYNSANSFSPGMPVAAPLPQSSSIFPEQASYSTGGPSFSPQSYPQSHPSYSTGGPSFPPQSYPQSHAHTSPPSFQANLQESPAFQSTTLSLEVNTAYGAAQYNNQTNQPHGTGAQIPHSYRDRKDWMHQSNERTTLLKSQFSANPFAWVFVSDGVIPSNAFVLNSENGQSVFLCRSFYEDQLWTGTVVSQHGQPTIASKASVIARGKESTVRQYEVLVRAFGQPQWSFASDPAAPSKTISQPSPQPYQPPVLNEVDIVFIVDDSDSMVEGDRWDDARNALAEIAKACGQFDGDGFDLYFLNDPYVAKNLTTVEAVKKAFNNVSPDGATPTGAKLNTVLGTHIPPLEDRARPSKPVSVVVITDGMPTDDVERVIVNAARRLDKSQVPESHLLIHFLQIGDDPDATNALKDLDDALENRYKIRDMVDTTVYDHSRPQFRAETLHRILSEMWVKQTQQTSSKTAIGQAPPRTFSPQPNSPPYRQSTLSPISLVSPTTAQFPGRINESSSEYFGQQQLHTSPPTQYAPLESQSTVRFPNKKTWIQQARESTKELMTPASSDSPSPFAWIFVDNDLPPSNAISCGYDHGQETFFVRSFYEEHMRFGKVVKGSNTAFVFIPPIGIGRAREALVKQYEVLVGPSAFTWSFASGPKPEQPTGMDIVLVVDDSDSMEQDARWEQARDALAAVAEESYKFDADGVDLYFLNSDRHQANIRTSQGVARLFNEVEPSGGTPTGRRLRQILDYYIPKVENLSKNGTAKPVNIIVLTDGDPTDDVADNVEGVIVNAARRLHRSRVPERMVGIQFVQIGNDEDATQALKELDSQLESKHDIRDMVDTTLFDSSNPNSVFKAETIFKILNGAIDRQVDLLDEQYRAREGQRRYH